MFWESAALNPQTRKLHADAVIERADGVLFLRYKPGFFKSSHIPQVAKSVVLVDWTYLQHWWQREDDLTVLFSARDDDSRPNAADSGVRYSIVLPVDG